MAVSDITITSYSDSEIKLTITDDGGVIEDNIIKLGYYTTEVVGDYVNIFWHRKETDRDIHVRSLHYTLVSDPIVANAAALKTAITSLVVDSIRTTLGAAGNNTEVQFNNSGVTDGDSNLTWDGTTLFVNTTVKTAEIQDDGGVRAFDVSNRSLYDNADVGSIDYNGRVLFDSANVISIDYGERTLYNKDGNAAIYFKDDPRLFYNDNEDIVFQIDSSGLDVILLGGDTLVENKVSSVVAYYEELASTSTAATTVFTPAQDGIYRVSTTLVVTTAGGGGTYNVLLDFTSEYGAETITVANTADGGGSGTLNMTPPNHGYINNPATIHCINGNAIQITVDTSGVSGTMTYNLYVTVERLT